MIYADAIRFLYDLRLFGAKFGLENTFKLVELAGNPQDRLRFIHVAGTNGKGSTCAMLEGIYRAAGLRVGLFTSPHLVSFRERIQIDRQLISEADVVRLVESTRELLEGFPHEQHPTFFEVLVVMGLRHFAEQKCDLVIWETGLGGRLDATNIVTPLASVITNVQLDHQQWLGDDLEKIAMEKSGIIKPGVPVVTAADNAEALKMIVETARQKNAPLTKVERTSSTSGMDESAMPLIGDHQRLNATLALATVEVLQSKIPVSKEAIVAGLSGVRWPGRLQVVKTSAGRTILLDGAHNEAGVETLKEALAKHFVGVKWAFVLGTLEDKDWRQMCKILAPLASRILTVPVSSGRTASAIELADVCLAINPTAKSVACKSLEEALDMSKDEQFVIVTGSLYLVGEAMEKLGLSPENGSERALNEWTGASVSG